jgi:AraC-like DNA-binding protein
MRAGLNGFRSERLVVEPEDQLAWLFLPSSHSKWHAQWGVALAMGLEGPVEIDHAGGTTRGRLVVVPAGLRHRTRSRGPCVVTVLDADAHRLTQVEARRDRPFALPAGSALGHALVTGRSGPGAARALAARFLPTGAKPLVDERFGAMVLQLQASIAEGHGVKLRHLAARWGLSASRFSDVFQERVGLSFSRWVRWRRVVSALPHLRPGELSRAASEVGFADHAHLARTCGDLLGYSPGKLATFSTLEP